ncbi:MAG: hypothetical protein DHS20C15_14460 [Planctomycetota bacterium]|nr:MAG: hypothetical protein DHS20C15_14460 [Planctomycetota bacterium]
MGFVTRRRLLTFAGLSALGVVGARAALPSMLRRPPPRELDAETAEFVERLLEGIDRSRIWDIHTHLFGLGDDATGCTVSHRSLSHLHVLERARFDSFLAVAGVDLNAPHRDEQYLQRLLALHRLGNPAGRLVLLAFDHVVDEQGEVQHVLGPYHTPDEYVLSVCASHPELEAGVSIHPYRLDAVQRLEAAVARGARLVKWLPAAMRIDPASPLCDPFYDALARLRTPLLTHAGSEAAVSADAQEFGNPLRLRRPLEAGVRVIVAHCAGLGTHPDLDEALEPRKHRRASKLFLRLMNEPQWEGQLFGGLSAVTQVNRSGTALAELLRARHLHHRLLNGSDYPLPAVDPLVSTWQLQYKGYLDARERRLCNQVFEANPLLFDLVLKRCLKLREGGRELRFSPTVFETDWVFA